MLDHNSTVSPKNRDVETLLRQKKGVTRERNGLDLLRTSAEIQ